MDIRKSKENFKGKKPRCFNCNLYRYMAKDCWRLKKKKNSKRYYKCEWVRHIAKDYKKEQKMKNWNIQEVTETDIEEKDKDKSFGEGLK